MVRTLAEVCKACERFVRPVVRDGVTVCPSCGKPVTPMCSSYVGKAKVQ